MMKNMVIGSKALRNGTPCHVGPASVDLTLSDKILIPVRKDQIALGDEVEYEEIRFSKEHPFVLNPGEFVLAATNETVHLTPDICGFVQGRSSIGRIGLTVQNAGFIDPGFDGTITLELVNESKMKIALIPGYRVVQIVLMDVRDNPVKYHGKYNGQKDPTGSRMHKDKEARK